MLLSFSMILLFTTYSNPVHAQLTKTLGFKITLAAVNNTTIRQELHSNGSTPFVFASPSSSLKNPSSALSTTSSFNNNHQSSQLPPIANAGPDQVVTAGSTVILNGSNSRAPNGIILSYSWMQIPTSAPSTLSGVNTPVWEFIAPNVTADTLLRFQLNVTDNLGQMGTAFVNILDKPGSTFVAPPPTKIMKSPSTAVTVPSNNPNRGSNSVNIPTNNASISPPLTPPINHWNTR
jgi:K319-like protein